MTTFINHFGIHSSIVVKWIGITELVRHSRVWQDPGLQFHGPNKLYDSSFIRSLLRSEILEFRRGRKRCNRVCADFLFFLYENSCRSDVYPIIYLYLLKYLISVQTGMRQKFIINFN